MAVVKRAVVVAVLALVGYFGIPMLAIVAGGAAWDGNGPRFHENTLGNTFFWLMMASFLVFVVAAVAAVVALVATKVRRSA